MRLIQIILLALTITSCAHHKDVRPGPNGVNRVLTTGDDATAAYRYAFSQAKSFCGEFNKTPVIMKENSKYIGAMSESDYRQAKAIVGLAKSVGADIFHSGKGSSYEQGKAVSDGAEAADSYLGQAYQVTLEFKCN